MLPDRGASAHRAAAAVAVDGPLRGDAPQDSGEAAFDQTLQELCEDVAEGARSVLGGVTLADLVAETQAASHPAKTGS